MSQAARRADPPVVLLHGWGGTCQQTWNADGWNDALAEAGRTAHGIDLPGHGTAPAPTDPARYRDLAALVLERLSGLPTNVDLVGYSLGAKVALEIARRDPPRVRRLVMLAAGDNVFGREQVDAIVSAIRDPLDTTLPPLARAVAAAGLASGNNPEALIACLRRPANPVFSPDDLHAVTAEVLLVAGDQDAAFKGHERIARSLRRACSVIVEGVDHISTPRSPAVKDRALSFLNAPHEADHDEGPT